MQRYVNQQKDRKHLQEFLSIKERRFFDLTIYEKGELRGYGLIRKCRRGYKIGPLFAEDIETAEAIYLNLSSYADEQETLYLDIPERNQAALALAKKYGIQKVFSTARMYTGKEPQIALNKVFGVTTFELG